MNTAVRSLAGLVLVLVAVGSRVRAADDAHPFMFMNRRDIAAARARIAQDEWARRELDAVRHARGRGKTFRDLFLYLVRDDQEAGQRQKKYLLSFIGAGVDRRPWSDNYLSALRYDAVYDLLSDAERRRIEETFRKHINWHLKHHKRKYTRTNWLPNMMWCRTMGMHLMAAAMRDEQLIRAMFNSNGGWKYYFDDYIADGYFYGEEFGKHYAMIGEMLLWCRAMERLGLNELGYGYTGKGGATMRKYLESIYRVGMPAIDLGTGSWQYPKMTMGDAKGGFERGTGYGFQQTIVDGYLADGRGGHKRWFARNMNGRDHKNRKVEKLDVPMWFEIAHVKWPDAHFDYFLAQLRKPGQSHYYPSLFWGCGAIHAEAVTPPAVQSFVAPERGIAVLRAEEGPDFWRSPKPCVGLRLSAPYAHSVPDTFAITGFYAFNRPIYLNRQVSSGYAGRDAGWSNSIRSHCSVMVDNQEPRFTHSAKVESEFGALAKFVSVTDDGVYEDVEQTRSLFLTDDYMLDIFELRSDRPRHYQWSVHSLGHAYPEQTGWAPTRHLIGSVYDLANEKSRVTDETWSVQVVQETAGAHPEFSGLGKSFFEKRPGVRVTMLGARNTIAYLADSPVNAGRQDRLNFGAREPAGVSILAARNQRRARFVALHEPFMGRPLHLRLQRLQADGQAAGVEIQGDDVHDFIIFNEHEGDAVVRDSGFSARCSGHVVIRGRRGKYVVQGDLRAMEIKAEDAQLVVDGKTVARTGADGWLRYPIDSQLKLPETQVERVPVSFMLGARWTQPVIRMPRSGQATGTLVFRNLGPEGLQHADIDLIAPPGLRVTPGQTRVHLPTPGDEHRMDVRFEATADLKPGLYRCRTDLTDASAIGFLVDDEIRVSVGVVSEWDQIWPKDFTRTIYAPRYVARYHYYRNTAAEFLLDPEGKRRHGNSGSFPTLYLFGKDHRGRERWNQRDAGGFSAFKPVPHTSDGGVYYLGDNGQHPHGYNSVFRYIFTEDWIWLELREGKFDDQPVMVDWPCAARVRTPPAEEALPQRRLYAVDGKLQDEAPEGEVQALWQRPSGYRYGELWLLPPGTRLGAARRTEGVILPPKHRNMAFTFCLEDEINSLLQAWQNQGALATRKWQQGENRK